MVIIGFFGFLVYKFLDSFLKKIMQSITANFPSSEEVVLFFSFCAFRFAKFLYLHWYTTFAMKANTSRASGLAHSSQFYRIKFS